MTITEAVAKKGYTFRQHLEEQGWGMRALTVVDLSADQEAALRQRGAAGLQEELRKTGQYSFPATDITAVPAIRNWISLDARAMPLVVTADELAEVAAKTIARIKGVTGVELKVVADGDADLGMLQHSDVILFGGAHQSKFGRDFALRYQTAAFDGVVPGPGGWAVTTHVGIEGNGNLLLQVVADKDSAAAATAALMAALETEKGAAPRFRWQHLVTPGPEMAAALTTWESYVASFPERLPMPTSGALPDADDIDGLAKFLLQGLDSGGIEVSWYNQAPLNISVECARYYMASGDERALRLFRALLFTMADYYLLTPEGASYPADFDFILGHMVLYYSRLEHTHVFSTEDRLFLSNLLLACSRSIHDYARAFWPPDHHSKPLASGESGEKNRHNHQTFPARSLLFAHDYFSRHGVADAAEFLGYAEAIFSGDMWNRGKQTENAGMYEVLVYDHGAVYSCFSGKRLDLFDPAALRVAAKRMAVITDNFFRAVDCGDTSVSMKRGSDETLAVLVSSCFGDEDQDWFASESIRHSHNHALLAKIPGHGTPGLRMGRKGRQPGCGRWERVPLDPQFVREYIPNPPQGAHLFDKMAFRTGWGDEDHYVLLEGIGAREISHSHIDCNSIVRLNHLGRHWLVSNGYGRLVGVTNVSKSFSSRVRGPEDHNMLVLQQAGEIVTETPRVCNQLCHGQKGTVAYSCSTLSNYGGTDWNRTVIIVAGKFLLVIDRVSVDTTAPDSAHIEWNCLGECTVEGDNAILEQNGVFLHVATTGNWPLSKASSERSADWQKVLSSGEYPHARFPLTKLLLQAPALSPGDSYTVVTLFSASTQSTPVYTVSQDSEQSTITVNGLDRKSVV